MAGVAVLWTAASASAWAEPEDDRSPPAKGATLRVDFEASYFEGDYGSGDPVTLDSLAARLRWRWDRFEVRVGLPMLRLRGDAILVGGSPSAGPPAAAPGGGGPPGAPAPAPTTADTSVSGIGDVRVRADYDLLQGTSARPWITGLLQVKLPTADETDGLGTGETDVEGGLQLIQPVGRANLLFEGRYTRIGDPPGFDFDDVVTAGAGLTWRIGSRPGRFLYAYLENRSHPVAGREDRRDVTLGTSLRTGAERRVRFTAAAYAGLSETAEDWGVQLLLGREF